MSPESPALQVNSLPLSRWDRPKGKTPWEKWTNRAESRKEDADASQNVCEWVGVGGWCVGRARVR